jgi:hypothetical protein
MVSSLQTAYIGQQFVAPPSPVNRLLATGLAALCLLVEIVQADDLQASAPQSF